MRTPVVALMVIALCAACPDRTLTIVPGHPNGEEEKIIPVYQNRDLDVLFVIDDSGSMAAEQASVRSNFPRFIEKLRDVDGGLPNVHIGVVSTDVGAGSLCNPGKDGLLQTHGAPVLGRYIEDLDDPSSPDVLVRIRNYDPAAITLEELFAQMADLGTSGCGFEQPLESMRRALDGRHVENAGFLRPDATLAVVILSDEDDCSSNDPGFFTNDPGLGSFAFRCTEFGVTCDGQDLPRIPGHYELCEPRTDSFLEDPTDYVSFLRGLKGDPRDVFVAGISGDLAPFDVVDVTETNGETHPELDKSCGKNPNDRNAGAVPAIRTKSFLDGFPDRSTFQTICSPDLSGALTQIAQAVRQILGTPCFAGDVDPMDLDPNAPGLQIQCQVSDVIDPGTDGAVETVIPRCLMQDDHTALGSQPAFPCWWAQSDPALCPATNTHMALEVERNGDMPPKGTNVVARCKTI